MNIYFAFQPLSSAKVNAESVSRPVGPSQPLALVLNRLEYSLTFAYRVKSKLLTGPIFGGAYTADVLLFLFPIWFCLSGLGDHHAEGVQRKLDTVDLSPRAFYHA